MSTVLVTGGAGFIGSHACELFASKGYNVIALDNLSRAKLLKHESTDISYNWNYLKKNLSEQVELIKGDVRDRNLLKKLIGRVDIVVHTAAQTAVTTSIIDPAEDFDNNVEGAFGLLEECRLSGKNLKIIVCSTNKVYGSRLNSVPLCEDEKRYSFSGKYKEGISEHFGIDLCDHSPYGCSKLAADLYAQEYAVRYGLNIGVFRMSCIYGPRQLGFEDQGWVAWFIIAALKDKCITIYGDGKQVRDILYVTDLIKLFDTFIQSNRTFGVYNTGGGIENTISLLEFIDILKTELKKEIAVTFSDWRPSDQKVFYSDISKVRNDLGWEPYVCHTEGIKKLIEWCRCNITVFKGM